MVTKEERRLTFLIVMNGFMAMHVAELEGSGMSESRLTECIARGIRTQPFSNVRSDAGDISFTLFTRWMLKIDAVAQKSRLCP